MAEMAAVATVAEAKAGATAAEVGTGGAAERGTGGAAERGGVLWA